MRFLPHHSPFTCLLLKRMYKATCLFIHKLPSPHTEGAMFLHAQGDTSNQMEEAIPVSTPCLENRQGNRKNHLLLLDSWAKPKMLKFRKKQFESIGNRKLKGKRNNTPNEKIPTRNKHADITVITDLSKPSTRGTTLPSLRQEIDSCFMSSDTDDEGSSCCVFSHYPLDSMWYL